MRVTDKRLKELNKIVEALEKMGWCVETFRFHDDVGEPFRFRLQMRYDPPKRTDVL